MTKVTKYAQSCFLFEKAGQRLLLDPGKFDLELHGRQPEDWPSLEGIIVTHEHFDHADLETIKFLVERDQVTVYSTKGLVQQLATVGVNAKRVQPNESIEIGRFQVRCIQQQHGVLSGGRPIPENIGFVIDETFYTPGDSVPVANMPNVPVLLVPVAGPEMNFETAATMIDQTRPQLAVAMHFSNMTSYPVDVKKLKELNFGQTEFLVLNEGESFSWPR